MQLVFPSLLAFVAFVVAQGNGPTISTPAAIVQCQPAQISFVASSTPVFISVIPGGQPSAAPLADLGQQTSSPFTWVVNLPAGREITLQIRDSTGAVAYSAPVTIQNSSDSSCLGAGASSSAGSPSSGAPASSSSVAATSSAAATTSAAVSSASSVSTSLVASTSSVVASVSSVISSATAPPSTSATRSASATSAAASPTTSTNSARTNAQVGFAGLLGLVAAAFMA